MSACHIIMFQCWNLSYGKRRTRSSPFVPHSPKQQVMLLDADTLSYMHIFHMFHTNMTKTRTYFMKQHIKFHVIMMNLNIMMMTFESAENGFQDDEQWAEDFESDPLMMVIMIASSLGYTGLAILSIYLIYKWSEKWNKQFENQ